jgi:hypothetical protein
MGDDLLASNMVILHCGLSSTTDAVAVSVRLTSIFNTFPDCLTYQALQ